MNYYVLSPTLFIKTWISFHIEVGHGLYGQGGGGLPPRKILSTTKVKSRILGFEPSPLTSLSCGQLPGLPLPRKMNSTINVKSRMFKSVPSVLRSPLTPTQQDNDKGSKRSITSVISSMPVKSI